MPESIQQAAAKQANHEQLMEPEEFQRQEKMAAYRHLMNALNAVEKKYGQDNAAKAAEMVADEVDASWN